ncbi:autotransporter outer membrane beta-barrel domain-containing protein [Planctomycetota bacterium]|nr:autotransporter outer membrane beta-barrel domain-containing protein [Planctomycetota bacterium]
MTFGSQLNAGWNDNGGGNWDYTTAFGTFYVDITTGGPLNITVDSNVNGSGPNGEYSMSLGGPSYWLQTDQLAAIDYDGKKRLTVSADNFAAINLSNSGQNSIDLDANSIINVISQSTSNATSTSAISSNDSASILDIGTLAGQIYVTSDNTTATYTNLNGIESSFSVVADEIASTAVISVDGPGQLNYGIYSNLGDITIGPGGNGNMAGQIIINGKRDGESDNDHQTRIANTANATGIHTFQHVTIHGWITGSIDVYTGESSGTSSAYGIYANETVSIGAIGSTGTINVVGQGDYVSGIRARKGISIFNEFAGQINVQGQGDYARGIYAGNEDILIGSYDTTGLIDVTGNGQYVAGIDGDDVTITGALAGDITVENLSSTGYSTDGIDAGGNLTIGSIASTSRIDITNPYIITNGLSALGNVNINGVMDGEILVNAKRVGESDEDHATRIASARNVNGIYAQFDVNIQDSLNGHIEVHAGHDSDSSSVAGIKAGSNVTLHSISNTGQIISRGDGYSIYGIYAEDGITITNDMAGLIDAKGKLEAAALYAHGADGITLSNVTGTISATVSETGWAAHAIRSVDPTADDSITLSTGANIIGIIDLGGETTQDVLTLRGNGTLTHEIAGVDRLVVQQDPGTASAKDEIWHYNVPGFSPVNENYDDIDVQYGMLGVGMYMQTDTLNVEADGGLYFTLLEDGTNFNIITNDATFKEGATIQAVLDGPITGKKVYTVVQSTNGITIDASGDPADLLFIPDTALIDYDASLSIDGNDLVITATAFEELQTYANKSSQKAAKSLQSAFDRDATGDAGDVLAAFQNMNEQQLEKELEKINPEQSVASANAAADTTSSFARKLTVRTQSLGSSSSLASANNENAYPLLFSGPSMRDEDGYEFWATAFGSISEQDDQDSIVGYTARSAGSLVGLDRMSENVLIGAAFGFAHADIDSNQSRGSTDLDAITTGIYFAYAPSNLKLEGGSIYTMGLSDYKRETALGRTAEADDVMSHTFTNYIGASIDYVSTDSKLKLIPNAQLAYTYFMQESYAESKAGALNLEVDSFNNDILTATLGLKTEYAYSDQLKINSLFAFKRDLVNDAAVVESSFQTVGSTPFKTSGIETDKNAFELGLGADYQVSDRMKASIDYTYEHRESLKTQNITVGLNILF